MEQHTDAFVGLDVAKSRHAVAVADEMPPFDTHEITRDVIAAQDRVGTLEPITARYPEFDISAAYVVARRVHEHRIAHGAQAVGRKIGFTNAEMWTLFGVQEPIWGYVYGHTLTEGAGRVAEFDLSRFLQPRIEPEIIVHFRDAPPPGASEPDLLACVDWVAHGFEIVQSHFPEWRFQAADTITDAGLHAALILGERVSVSQLGHNLLWTLAAFSVDLSCDGVKQDTGSGANVLGNPISAVAHLLRILAAQDGSPPIHAGELITTGTLTKAFPIRPGERWETEIHGIGLPGLAVQFLPSVED